MKAWHLRSVRLLEQSSGRAKLLSMQGLSKTVEVLVPLKRVAPATNDVPVEDPGVVSLDDNDDASSEDLDGAHPSLFGSEADRIKPVAVERVQRLYAQVHPLLVASRTIQRRAYRSDFGAPNSVAGSTTEGSVREVIHAASKHELLADGTTFLLNCCISFIANTHWCVPQSLFLWRWELELARVS